MASGKKMTNSNRTDDSKDSSPALAANLSLPLSSQSTEPVGPDSVAIQIDRPLARRRTFKIIVLGDSGVGKTCLTYRFCQGIFPQRTDATVGVDFREKTVQVGSEMVKLQLWDTAGQERFRKSMVPHYYRNVHAIVYVYDVTKRSSFENIVQWMAESDMHNPGRHLPSVLVGNKCDSPIHMVAVHTNVAQRFAESHQMELFETSAKEESKSDHVESIFITLICKLMLLRTGLTPTPDDSKLRPQLVELKPVIIKKHEDCTC